MAKNPISDPILASLTQFWVPKNGEKPHFGPELRPLGPNSGYQFFFFFLFFFKKSGLISQ